MTSKRAIDSKLKLIQNFAMDANAYSVNTYRLDEAIPMNKHRHNNSLSGANLLNQPKIVD